MQSKILQMELDSLMGILGGEKYILVKSEQADYLFLLL